MSSKRPHEEEHAQVGAKRVHLAVPPRPFVVPDKFAVDGLTVAHAAPRDNAMDETLWTGLKTHLVILTRSTPLDVALEIKGLASNPSAAAAAAPNLQPAPLPNDYIICLTLGCAPATEEAMSPLERATQLLKWAHACDKMSTDPPRDETNRGLAHICAFLFILGYEDAMFDALLPAELRAPAGWPLQLVARWQIVKVGDAFMRDDLTVIVDQPFDDDEDDDDEEDDDDANYDSNGEAEDEEEDDEDDDEDGDDENSHE